MKDRKTITWNTANGPRTGAVVAENEQEYLVETDGGKFVNVSKRTAVTNEKKPERQI